MELNKEAITAFFCSLIKGLPAEYESQEIILGNVVYFCLNGLAMLGTLETALSKETRDGIIEWIYSNQVEPPLHGGFRHSPCHFTPSRCVEETHITMIYTAIASLIILGDDLMRVDKKRVMETLKSFQLPSGSFLSHHLGSEDDVRFVFSAAAIMDMLGTNEGIDTEKAIEYLLSCQTYEGGFAHEPGDEAHGGATYCAVAALKLFGALDRIRDPEMLNYWLSQRQQDGFNGRTHKLTDTCYSFWIGSPISVLGLYDDLVDKDRLTAFIFSHYCNFGMFRANEEADPDIVHTHFSLAGLSLAGYPGIQPIDPALGFVIRNKRN